MHKVSLEVRSEDCDSQLMMYLGVAPISVCFSCLIRSFSSSRCPDMQKIACRYTQMAGDKAREASAK